MLRLKATDEVLNVYVGCFQNWIDDYVVNGFRDIALNGLKKQNMWYTLSYFTNSHDKKNKINLSNIWTNILIILEYKTKDKHGRWQVTFDNITMI